MNVLRLLTSGLNELDPLGWGVDLWGVPAWRSCAGARGFLLVV